MEPTPILLFALAALSSLFLVSYRSNGLILQWWPLLTETDSSPGTECVPCPLYASTHDQTFNSRTF
ncbi:uncharacterized protein Nmag_3705 (plasmid) [Natrialba magadii ATCC 43099]|uniref:Uncharacterized protein n=1 Tax=Natrialba magadii (strain ATCC 43099 / DSM 3394 / CCM 3739 / CIP 104546 / IAM 13178 / JCM 8861 / NBRC 102185 / NCIMB 2190 / MS3) TaxID=547559 RepID=D3T0Y8_NATMM|nr:uncharacterized protein Nmag_3705 [Natrialba magadii ATCC 43099]